MENEAPLWAKYAGDAFFLVLFLVILFFFKPEPQAENEFEGEEEEPNPLEKILVSDEETIEVGPKEEEKE